MNIKIISDSTCDLSPALIKEYDVTLFPLTVVKEGEQFKDGITITPADIFNHVANGGNLCTTAASSVGEYSDIFAKYVNDYDGVVHITIGSGFSSCYQNACLAAAEYPNVRVIDSQSLSTGQGLVVLKASELAKTCTDLDSLVSELNAFTPRVEISFLLDRLEYMVKGGRCSSAIALGANLLNLKPCIEVRDGKMIVVKKYRGHYDKCLANYVKDRLNGRRDELDHDRLFITHTPVSDECYSAVISAVKKYGFFDRVDETTAGCTVSCHCGPGTLGIVFVRK